MVTVCTVLPPPERPRVDAAADGCFATLHAASLRDALRAARRKRVDALVLSVHACRGEELPAVPRFVREFPAPLAVAEHPAPGRAPSSHPPDHPHGPLLPREPPVTPDLPTRNAARAGGVSVRQSRVVNKRRRVPARLLLVAEPGPQL